MVWQSEFVRFVLDLLATVGGIRARAMFGGFGIYRGDTLFAIIVEDRLFLKADEVTRHEFESRGLGPFTYVARGRTVTLSYYEAAPDVFESPDAMRHWTQRAVGAALRARIAKKQPRHTRRATPRGRRG
jgi:DNA transformation protein